LLSVYQVFNVDMREFDNLDKNGRLLSHAAVVKVRRTVYDEYISSLQTALQTIIERFVSRLQYRNEFNSDRAILQHIRSLGERHATVIHACNESKSNQMLQVRPQGFTPDLWFPFAEALASIIDTWPVPVFHRSAMKVILARKSIRN
jgi:hypothetical protein